MHKPLSSTSESPSTKSFSQPAVELLGVSKSFALKGGELFEVLRQINISVPEESFVTLIGPSGCGKSTILNIIAHIQNASAGEVRIKGQLINAINPKLVAMVFQEAALFPWRSALANVEFPMIVRGLPRSERLDKAARYLELVGLRDFADRFPHELSVGMQQRVSIARALAMETPILLMDEPFGALDEQTRLTLSQELTRVWLQSKRTILFVTHSLLEAAFLSDIIIVLTGRPCQVRETVIVEETRPRELESQALSKVRAKLWALLSQDTRSLKEQL